MSMTFLTLLQIIKIFSVYSFMTILVPYFVLNKIIKKYNLLVRFLICITVSNFYMMNTVFLLQILKISNRFTLILSTIIPVYFAYVKINHINVIKNLKKLLECIHNFVLGHIKIKSAIYRLIIHMCLKIKNVILAAFKLFLRNPIEWIVCAAIFAYICWIYGANSFYSYGYNVSDLPVHNYWINYMSRKKIFVAGVYPFGFHCIVYYLHTIFNIETYVILRLFNFVQVVYIHLVLIAFLRLCCKSKYASYFGFLTYVLLNTFSMKTTERFYSALPQEFGMIFIFPGIYFAFKFFEKRKYELCVKKAADQSDKDTNDKKIEKSTKCLILFAMNFSMTLAVHFYDTMIAGLFCIAIAIGYCIRFFNRKYFFRVILWGLLSVFIAAAPMLVAFSLGTPLQGSLGWGMNVIKGKDTQSTGVTQQTTSSNSINGTGNNIGAAENKSTGEDKQNEKSQPSPKNSHLDASKKNDRGLEIKNNLTFSKKLKRIFALIYSAVNDEINASVISKQSSYAGLAVFSLLLIVLLTSLVNIIYKEYDYAFMMISSAIYIFLMSILLVAGKLKLPQLMDTNRSRVFYGYSLTILFAFVLDSVLWIILRRMKKRIVLNVVSFICCIVLVTCAFKYDIVRKPHFTNSLESRGAICTLTNIVKTNKDKTWTIVSANDEMRMAEDYGYHYESITFLRQMESIGSYGSIIIPTHYVYFFIEKVPLDYLEPYGGSGQMVSEKGAEKPLPVKSGLEVYQGESRWIVMSRMYYWAQRFRQMYPDDMKVYYEDDNFICYVVKQNDYSLYNFAIDYKYNVKNMINKGDGRL